jgi:hypothetical protein
MESSLRLLLERTGGIRINRNTLRHMIDLRCVRTVVNELDLDSRRILDHLHG